MFRQITHCLPLSKLFDAIRDLFKFVCPSISILLFPCILSVDQDVPYEVINEACVELLVDLNIFLSLYVMQVILLLFPNKALNQIVFLCLQKYLIGHFPFSELKTKPLNLTIIQTYTLSTSQKIKSVLKRETASNTKKDEKKRKLAA